MSSPSGLRRLAVGVALACGPAAGLLGQSFVGPSKCVTCHDHERQTIQWQKTEPAQLKGKAHFNTLKQLDDPKAMGYARAIGLADPYDVKGDCVKCHATVFRGDANAGVSCESCHGPASAYLEPHQQKGSHARSIGQGLRDLRDQPAAIGRMCVDCHVTPDKRLAAAGHPTGAGWDPGAALPKLVHWQRSYSSAQVSAAGKAAAATRLAGVKAAAPARAAAAPAPAAAAPAAAPAPSVPSAAAAAPWDWSQPVRELPADYVPEPAPAAPPAAAPRAARRAPAEPLVPPSLAEDAAIPQPTPGLAAPLTPALSPASEAPRPPVPAAPAAPLVAKDPVGQAAEARGRALRLVEELLRKGVRAPGAPAPAKPGEFSGPDSELLRLQDEVLVLAIEALRRPQ
jgi:hypothetical protein